jgi:putative nucleotidyltransferase with HDIG domain
MKIDLGQTLISLTGALDFVGIDEIHHGKRVALMAGAVAAELGWAPDDVRDMIFAGLVHDCGVSRHREHRLINETLEWEGAEEHCIRGESYLAACPPLDHFREVVRWHHTRWEMLQSMPLSRDVKLRANLVFLADRADVLIAGYFSGQSMSSALLWEYPGVLDRLQGLAGSRFASELVAAFARAATRESFWLCMDPPYINDDIRERLEGSAAVELDARDALAVAGLFARTVDAKSSYTLEHSTRVARIVRYLAERLGLAGEQLDLIEIAALLHDIGKLRVPEEIIDKPGALTAQERAFVMRHSYDTGRLLSRIFPGQPIAGWASMHHENLLGTGYPDHRGGETIPREARLIAVSDIFQALAQQRPYRTRLAAREVMQQLDELAALGRIDRVMVEHLRAHLDACYALATE